MPDTLTSATSLGANHRVGFAGILVRVGLIAE
jgi:hypothetical protein